MKLSNKLLLAAITIAMLAYGCKQKTPDAPQSLVGNDTGSDTKLHMEEYALEMIANYHQNLTLEQYRSVKMWTVNVSDLQALIDLAKRNGQSTVHIFPAASTPLKRLAKKYNSLKEEYADLVESLVEHPEQ